MCVFLLLLLSPRPFILRTERKERGRFVRIKIAFRTVKRALISCRSEWKGCFGIFKLVDAYRRNVQLKRRCSGLESRERQLNRKITRPGENLSVYPPIKRMQIYRETCPVINVIIASRDRLSGEGGVIVLFIFFFPLSLIFHNEISSSFPSKKPKGHALFEFLLFSRLLSLRFKDRFDHDNLFFPSFSISRECLRRGSISASISHYGLANYN